MKDEPYDFWSGTCISINPTQEDIKEIISRSESKTAKWLRDSKTGDAYYWVAEKCTHAKVAGHAKVEEYTKGIAVND